MTDVSAMEQELLEEMENNPSMYTDNGRVLVIDNNLRKIIIPESIGLLGVESDDEVNRLHFRMPKMYGEFDLSTFAVRINYMNRKKVNGAYVANLFTADKYAVDDVADDGEYISFSWLVGRNAVKYMGDTRFIVCLKKSDDKGNVIKEFNTTLAVLPVLEGLETTQQIAQENPDIIEQILKRLDGLGTGGSGTGTNAREIELQKGETAIQWRYAGETLWTDLVLLEDIKGDPGRDGRGITSVTVTAEGHLQINYSDGTETDAGKVMGEDGMDGVSGIAVRQEMTAEDTAAELRPNILYIFPEMAELSLTFAAVEDAGIVNEYHVVFTSGSTATALSIPDVVRVGNLTIEANRIYELSVLENCLTWQSWEAAG